MSGNGNKRLREMSGRQQVNGAAARRMEVRNRTRLWRIPTFWVIVLFAFIALLVMLLTSCGRQITGEGTASPSLSVSASPTATSESTGPAISATQTPKPSATAEPSDPLASPEETTGGTAFGNLWPVPRGAATPTGVAYGYADKEGRFVIPPEFYLARPFTAQGLALVYRDADTCAVIDSTGRQLVPWTQAYIQLADEGPIVATSYGGDGEDGGSRVYDTEGNLLFDTEGSLSGYSEGLAVLHEDAGKGFETVGYVDENGTLIIPSLFGDLGDFHDGYAMVAETYGGPRHYINRTGADVTAALSDGITLYEDMDTQLLGYMQADFNVLTDAVFVEAEPFRDGTAIVAYSPDPQDYSGLYGLLDTSGEWVLEPTYSGIRRMRNGLFLVGEPLLQAGWIPMYPPYLEMTDMALFNAAGDEIIPFGLQAVEDADANWVSVSDGNEIWMVDGEGAAVREVAHVPGCGTLRWVNGFLMGKVDGVEQVFLADGTLVADHTAYTELGDGIGLRSAQAEGNRYTDLSYPVVEGLADDGITRRINDQIRSIMGTGLTDEPERDADTGLRYVETLEGGWQGWRMEDLLVVEQSSYWYPMGAAHGSPGMATAHFDMRTGDRITLTDLFAAGRQVEGLRFLSQQVTAVIQRDMDEVGYFVDHVDVAVDQAFRMTPDGLVLYWAPYELASYAAYFREFTIPWADLRPYADTESAAWTSMRQE